MDYKIITPPTTEPITLSEAKLFCKIDADTTEDVLISGWIKAAREYCEEYTRRALAEQTIEAFTDHFPCRGYMELPRPPLRSVVSMIYKKSDGTEVTMTADTQYLVDAESTIGRIVLPYGVSWPSFTPHPINPIKVRYVAGYEAEKMPHTIKNAMYLHIGFFYRNRDAVELDKEADRAIKRLLVLWKVGWF